MADRAPDYALSHTKTRYREIFQQVEEALQGRFAACRPPDACTVCAAENRLPAFLDPLHPGCGYEAWYRQCLQLLEQEVGKEVLERLQLMEAYKQTFSCHQCGVCCRFASSEDNYETLQEKAAAGDSFAQQFTSVFLPYASREEAQKRYPALVDAVLKETETPDQISFYHCPYVGEDNRCTIYGTAKRPAICASYPDTPLTFIYDKCAWRPWKDEVHDDALVAHATVALCHHYQARLKALLQSD